MLSPATLRAPSGIQGPDILFVKPFGVESSIRDTAHKIASTFGAAGMLRGVVEHSFINEACTFEPTLGLLDQQFELVTHDRRGKIDNVRIAPMGINNDRILLGTFSWRGLELTDTKNPLAVFGGETPPEYYDFAYATIDSNTARHAGFGLIAMSGKVALFERQPSDQQLVCLTNSETEASLINNDDFPISRLDVTQVQAMTEWRHRLSQRHPV
jgi:hypothetical protein